MKISPEQHAAALANLYPEAREHVAAHWKLGRLEARAAKAHSSQALCVSVFETIARRRTAERDRVFTALLASAGLAAERLTDTDVATEVRQHRHVLGELGGGTPTALDGLLEWPAGVVTIESKFTERTFEGCSQASPSRARPADDQLDRDRPDRIDRNCSGNHEVGSDLKPSTKALGAACRLTVQDGRRTPRRYWELAPNIFQDWVCMIPARPCPFASTSYQLMRNIAFAFAWARERKRPYYGFVVTIVDSSPKSATLRGQIADFRMMLLPEVAQRVGVISYEQIAGLLDAHNEHDLASWIRDQINRGIPGR